MLGNQKRFKYKTRLIAQTGF